MEKDRPKTYDGMAPQIYAYEINPDQKLLSPRRAEVLALVAKGLNNKEIATLLDIEKNTVRKHLEYLFSVAKEISGNREGNKIENRIAMYLVFARPEVDVLRTVSVMNNK